MAAVCPGHPDSGKEGARRRNNGAGVSSPETQVCVLRLCGFDRRNFAGPERRSSVRAPHSQGDRFRSTSVIALGSAMPDSAPALVLTGSLCTVRAWLTSSVSPRS